MLRLVESVAQRLFHAGSLFVLVGDVADIGQSPQVAGFKVLGEYDCLAEIPGAVADRELIFGIKAATVAVEHIRKGIGAECLCKDLRSRLISEVLLLAAYVLVV